MFPFDDVIMVINFTHSVEINFFTESTSVNSQNR